MTLFKPEMVDLIVTGKKTQTRRVIDERHSFLTDTFGNITALLCNGRVRFRVGEDYAVQVKRGGRGVWANGELWYAPGTEATPPLPGYTPARIQIQSLRKGEPMEIFPADARAEGFEDCVAFWNYWYKLYERFDQKIIAVEFKLLSVPEAVA